MIVSAIYSVFILNYWPVLSEYFRRFARFFSLAFWSSRYFYVVTAGLSFHCMTYSRSLGTVQLHNIEMWLKLRLGGNSYFSPSEFRKFYNCHNSYKFGAFCWASPRIAFHYSFPANKEKSKLGVLCCVVLCGDIFHIKFWNSWILFTKFHNIIL